MNWKRIPFVYFPIMLLSERLISPLESVLPKPDRCFYRERAETRKGHVYSSEAQGICFEGQQSACNYSEPQLMALKSPLKLCFQSECTFSHVLKCPGQV